tara:strand:- start:564 stop:1031 length:468 start_codon:yes stop_codon:yes gene_type:complete
MNLKKKEFFIFIFLILLQSCSGGRIGNFLQSSFDDLEKINKEKDSLKNSDNKKSVIQDYKEINDENYKITSEVEKQKTLLENKKDTNLEKIKKNKKVKNSSNKKNIELQSYKIIFILKDVDPKDPTEQLSNILSNSELNFEIEKIERILETKNKK